jgi:hypothetical protein
MTPNTAYTTYCPTCDDRTVHNAVRREDAVGRFTMCRGCTDVDERLGDDLELAV